MAVNRNLDLSLTIRQIRILNNYLDRTINILTRSNDDLTVLVNLDRDVIAILILSGDLGVLIRVGDNNASVLLLISRINRLHIGIINRSLVITRLIFAVTRLGVRVLRIGACFLLFLVGSTVIIIIGVSLIRLAVAISVTLNRDHLIFLSDFLTLGIGDGDRDSNVTLFLILTPVIKLLRGTGDLTSLRINLQATRQVLNLNLAAFRNVLRSLKRISRLTLRDSHLILHHRRISGFCRLGVRVLRIGACFLLFLVGSTVIIIIGVSLIRLAVAISVTLNRDHLSILGDFLAVLIGDGDRDLNVTLFLFRTPVSDLVRSTRDLTSLRINL